MNKVRLIATAAFGIESVVGQELKRLGFENITIEMVEFYTMQI